MILDTAIKFSDITEQHIKRYLNIEDSFKDDDDMIYSYLISVKQYILDYTNLTIEELNNIASVNLAVFMLTSDAYSRRSAAFGYDNNKINFILKSILDMNRRWL